MIAIDMQLDELEMYKGSNIIAGDFNEFWDERIKEANNSNLEFSIEKSEINNFENIDFYILKFKGVNGEKMSAKYLKLKSEKKTPLILQFHGYPGSSRGWFEQSSFAGLGFSVLALDNNGQGGKSIDNSSYKGTTVAGHIVLGLDGEPKDMYYTKLFQNTIMIYRIAKSLEGVDSENIYVNGASQGGGLAIACAALNPEIKKCGVLYPFLSDYKRVFDMDLDTIAYEGLRYYSKWFAATLEEEKKMFLKLSYVDVSNLARRVKAKVIMGTGLIDTICPPSTQFAIYNNLNTKKEHFLFRKFGHEEISCFDDKLIEFFL